MKLTSQKLHKTLVFYIYFFSTRTNSVNDISFMEKSELNAWIMANSKYYPEDKILFIRKKLEAINEEDELLVSAIEKKDSVIGLIFRFL